MKKLSHGYNNYTLEELATALTNVHSLFETATITRESYAKRKDNILLYIDAKLEAKSAKKDVA